MNNNSFEQDEPIIDTSDIPELDASFWEKAKMIVPTKETTDPCIVLVQNMLRDFPECRKDLAYVLLEFKYRLEEGIGQKQ